MSAASEQLRRLMLDGADKLELPVSVRQVEALAREVAGHFGSLPGASLVDCTMPQLGMPDVTGQQYAVWMGMVAGETVAATAKRLCIGPASVQTHRRALYKRLGVSTPAEAVAQAALCGLVTESSVRSAAVL
jgi:DNA-binding CsgD family transcriptional regulator